MLMKILRDEGSAFPLPTEVRWCIVRRRQPAEVRRFGEGYWARHDDQSFKVLATYDVVPIGSYFWQLGRLRVGIDQEFGRFERGVSSRGELAG